MEIFTNIVIKNIWEKLHLRSSEYARWNIIYMEYHSEYNSKFKITLYTEVQGKVNTYPKVKNKYC